MTEREKERFYASSAWKRARLAALRRDRYLCQDCLARARSLRQAGASMRMDIPSATVVHHIVPYEQEPGLGLELGNLLSVCGPCHNARHPEKLCGRRPSQRPKEDNPLTAGVEIYKI